VARRERTRQARTAAAMRSWASARSAVSQRRRGWSGL